jgi:hypothetical protein
VRFNCRTQSNFVSPVLVEKSEQIAGCYYYYG